MINKKHLRNAYESLMRLRRLANTGHDAIRLSTKNKEQFDNKIKYLKRKIDEFDWNGHNKYRDFRRENSEYLPDEESILKSAQVLQTGELNKITPKVANALNLKAYYTSIKKNYSRRKGRLRWKRNIPRWKRNSPRWKRNSPTIAVSGPAPSIYTKNFTKGRNKTKKRIKVIKNKSKKHKSKKHKSKKHKSKKHESKLKKVKTRSKPKNKKM